MKTYANGMKATSITRKQIGVLFGKAKRGELKVQKFVMSDFYDIADFYNYDDNGNVERAENQIRCILDAVFAKDDEKAQKFIDSYTETLFNQLGRKAQQKANRNLVA